ncbi:unnamed protein product [Heligmosomoides polygyrus]|uniref:MICOS complex subunit n=1 Tax=Heligmosomoides polygyrus TaxID=6339 RepID=A0A183FN99_HELPZ|nr:unnamed protein product [Heligmosomoides polygyrus]
MAIDTSRNKLQTRVQQPRLPQGRNSQAGSRRLGVFRYFRVVNSPPVSPPPPLISALPLYPEDAQERSYKFVPEDPLPLQREFATIRKTFGTEFSRVAVRLGLPCWLTLVAQKCLVKTLLLYVDEEWTVLPKAAAITVGGMAGFVLGLRRGVIGRSFSTAIGLATMAAFCYPYETVDVIRTGVAHSESAWERFRSCMSFHVDLSPPK